MTSLSDVEESAQKITILEKPKNIQPTEIQEVPNLPPKPSNPESKEHG